MPGTSSRVAPRISIMVVPNWKMRRRAAQSYDTPGSRGRQTNPAPMRTQMSKPVVTRFAPSPTGYLHIGGARTALFNWLYARHTGGKMLLRIEDTDRERSTEAAIGAILEGLNWLGLEWDGEPLFQFARAARHREVAEALLAAGKAYRCYASPAELEEMRDAARKAGRSRLYDGRWRDRDPKDAPAGVKPVIRLKNPLEGETVIDDRVQGRVAWQNADLDDMIILRSDGTPVYNHAVVVDDHDMGVTPCDPRRRSPHQRRPPGADLQGHGLGRARLRPRAADPRPRRRQAVQAPRRARHRGLPRHGLPAGRLAQLSGAPRLEPWRRRDLLHRAGDPVVRHRRHQQVAGPARLRQARRCQQPLHPPGQRRRS